MNFKGILFPFLFVSVVTANDQVNVNTADVAQLDSMLLGVGAKKAQLIVDWRTQHGPFKNHADLAQVKGFGAKLVEKNKDRIVFSSQSMTSTRHNSRSATHSNELSWPVGQSIP